MEIKVQVPFQQLLALVKRLTPAQKARLRKELVDQKPVQKKNKDEFINYLLKGPVYSDKEIKVIEENRKSIATWRTKG
ncbi:MAG: hypothetical protein M9933_12175 [Chitinophagaceae bacterium]|nr:hypothetical protein [Chitinophagaceae bacterium]